VGIAKSIPLGRPIQPRPRPHHRPRIPRRNPPPRRRQNRPLLLHVRPPLLQHEDHRRRKKIRRRPGPLRRRRHQSRHGTKVRGIRSNWSRIIFQSLNRRHWECLRSSTPAIAGVARRVGALGNASINSPKSAPNSTKKPSYRAAQHAIKHSQRTAQPRPRCP